jgi:K+-sensing histidine kinase KdpD
MDLDGKEVERSLTSLLRLGDRLNSTFDLDSLLQALTEEALELTAAESGCAGLRTGKGMSCNKFLQGSDVVYLAYDCAPGVGWPGWVLTHGASYLTNDAGHDTVITPEVRERFGIKSGMSIPITDSGRNVIGFFEVYNKKTGLDFTPQDLKTSLAASQIASFVIQNALTHKKLEALAAFSRSLSLARDLEDILQVAGRHLEVNFQCGSAILLPADGRLQPRFHSPEFPMTAIGEQAATRCWEQSQEVANPFSEAGADYFPLTVRGQVIGVLGLETRHGALVSTTRRELLAGFISQTALAVEHGILEQKVRILRLNEETDRVQNALLTAVSHEVRAPLAAITAAVSGVLNPLYPLGQDLQRQLLSTVEYEAKRLHRLMNNLLNVTRLQAGVWRVKIEPCDFPDVVGAALEDIGTSTLDRRISIDIPEDLPMVAMDFDLITQVLVNLLSNALKYSSSDSLVHLRGQMFNDRLEVTVADHGVGIPTENLERAFQKFHRLVEASSADGLGLGLSICKEFVEAHGGRIGLENNPGGGTIARFWLPALPKPVN